jgi:LPXTG-motif cell wall-anchored protein
MRKRKDETMKSMKRVLAFALAAVMTAAMSLTALAADDDVQTVTVGTSGGSITITNTTKEYDYAIYKLFDATVDKNGVQGGKGIAYTLPSGKTIEDPATNWFETKTIGTGDTAVTNVTAKDALTPDVLKSDDFKTWATRFGTQVGTTVTADKNSIKFDKIPYGYYYITSSLGAVLTVDSTTPNGVVIDKNQIPSHDNGNEGKVIMKDGKKATVSNASLNEHQTFDIGVNATNYDGEKKIWRYGITDELGAGMTYDMENLSVTVDGTVIKKSKDGGADNGYVITYYEDAAMGAVTQDITKAQAFRVEMNWTDGGTLKADHLYANAVEIHVTYQAFLDPAKADKVQSGSTPNENKTNFYFYSDNDNPDIPPQPITPEKKTKTYTTEVEISKVDESGAALEGAEFTLTSTDGAQVVITITDLFEEDAQGAYWKLKDGSYTATDPNGENINKDLYEDLDKKYKKTPATIVKGEGQTETSMSAFVDSTGKVVFRGLGEGTYKIEETVVPSGFNKAADVEFTVSFDADTKKFSVESESEITVDENKLKVTIQNNKGVELPSTGGAGTTMFYIIGSILVIGAGIVLVAKRRMNLR